MATRGHLNTKSESRIPATVVNDPKRMRFGNVPSCTMGELMKHFEAALVRSK